MPHRTRSSALCNDDWTPASPAAVPVTQKGWRCCWGRFQCFALRKREDRGPATQLVSGSTTLQNQVENGSLASVVLNQAAVLSPVMHVPPSSPASFQYSDNLSFMPSPAALLSLFPLKSGNERGEPSLEIESIPRKATGGSFSVDAVLVTPPIYSTLTTAPSTPLSTAPFTPPPELAHLTTPPSPEVPLAKLVASSFNSKGSLPEHSSEHNNPIFLPAQNLELAYQLYPGSPIGQLVSPRSGGSSSGTSSSLPERIPHMENDASAAVSVLSSSMSRNATSFGVDEEPFETTSQTNDSEILQQCRKSIQEDRLYQTERAIIGQNSESQKGAECSHSLLNDIRIGQRSSAMATDIQTIGSAGSTSKCTKDCLASSQVSVSEGSKFSTGMGMERLYEGTEKLSNEQDNSDQSKDPNQVSRMYSHPAPNSSLEQLPVGRCNVVWQDQIQENGTCCSTCGELSSRCRELSEDLQQTKEKLSLIERRENLIDDRERVYKQLIQWMQLGAKSQQESIFRLSEELSWQEEAFLDLQAQHLAQLGISLPDIGRDLSRT